MKTNIRKLDSVTHNDTAATKLINDNFEALQQGIEDALSRSGKTPNFMDAALDMNMNRIINIADPVDDYDLANKHYVDTKVAGLQEQIDAEELRAKAAEAVLDGKIDAETARAKGVEGNLSELTTTDKSDLVSAINEVDGDVASIEETIEGYGDIVTHDADEFATAAQGEKADTALQPEDVTEGSTDGTISVDGADVPVHGLGTAAYADSSDFAAAGDIPTVGNGTITFVQGGVVKGTITTNQSGDATITLGDGSEIFVPSQYYASSATFGVNDYTVNIDVSSVVANGVAYYPIVFIDPTTSKNVSTVAVYTTANKTVTLARDPLSTTSETVYFRMCLIPLNATLATVEGLATGQYTPSAYNAYYTKAEADVLLGAKADASSLNSYQLISNLVTSVSSSSTDSQYPSAKLFYDTCGDIETLINAL
jgi:hypothetical protein